MVHMNGICLKNEKQNVLTSDTTYDQVFRHNLSYTYLNYETSGIWKDINSYALINFKLNCLLNNSILIKLNIQEIILTDLSINEFWATFKYLNELHPFQKYKLAQLNFLKKTSIKF